MTQLDRHEEISALWTLAHRRHVIAGSSASSHSSVRCQTEQRHKQTNKFYLEELKKTADWQIWTSVPNCSCPVFFSLICQDNHFPILLNKHRLPCLNTATVLKSTSFNHSLLSTLARGSEKKQNILNISCWFCCDAKEQGVRPSDFRGEYWLIFLYSSGFSLSFYFRLVLIHSIHFCCIYLLFFIVMLVVLLPFSSVNICSFSLWKKAFLFH